MNREDYLSVSGADYIRAMFANTQADGALFLEDEGENGVTWFMDWQKEDADEVVARFETLLAALTKLGKEHTRWETSTKDMPADLLEVWNTYIVPYPDHGMDHEKLFEISMKAEFDEKLTLEEEELLVREQEWQWENALTRLPYNRCHPVALIQRAKRYEKLIKLQAPQVVLDNEARCLAAEMVLYYCMKK